ncbi:hypothetical protein [Puerhibacterium puerhi]|uniref:hypothetical protein n=1 Tax=Puerhibacterium puerhi TaxID=2692623 RepID=UPI00135CA209|nr:hypothetical protein [Puerhibacterium puerhi]
MNEPTQVDVNGVMNSLRVQLSDATFAVAIQTARAEQAEARVRELEAQLADTAPAEATEA